MRIRLIPIIPAPKSVALPANCPTMRISIGTAPSDPLRKRSATAAEETIPPNPTIKQTNAANRISNAWCFMLGVWDDASGVFAEGVPPSLMLLRLPFFPLVSQRRAFPVIFYTRVILSLLSLFKFVYCKIFILHYFLLHDFINQNKKAVCITHIKSVPLFSGMDVKEKARSELKGTTLRVYWVLLKHGEKGAGPRDIMRELGLSSPSVAAYHLEKLRNLGLVEKTEGGVYLPKKNVDVEVVSDFVSVLGMMLPRFFFYSVLFTTMLITFLVVYPLSADPQTVVALVFGLTASIIFWVETLRVMRRRPF